MLPILLIIGAFGGVLIALVVQRRWRRARGIAAGLLVSYVTILVLLGGIEAYLRFGYAESENVITLATQNWLARYWHTNALGYRDRDWTPADWAGKQTVMVVGDSFAAGWGIENTADRFPDVLAAHLGDDYALINIAQYGTATPEQLEMLRAHPLQDPDIVILQYFLNDISYAGLSLGLLPTPDPLPAWANESAIGNLLYTRLLASWVRADDWWQWNYDAYDNVGIWSVHEREIDAFIDYTESIGARLIVVIFPNLLDPVRSVAYIDRVAQVFEARGHTDVLKLFDAAAAWSPAELMVSARDTHPSIAFHQYVGDTLYDLYFAPDNPTDGT
ncbi:MAG: SGNH/GDSL hydrolase family protein [Chloroflexota bacterium]|nr:SGNH/GDSL hydrolase family protein [Chloroflexota bacterium]